ncbi:MAG: hypothetical protein GX112_06270 [Clostridiaceae bacterium]|nr:hypothetical protein [Clostridiaceae bacterium]
MYYFPIRTTSRTEGAINKAQALDQIGTWSDQLIRSSQALHGQLDRLEKPLIQLLAQLSETDFLNSDDAVQIMEHLAARRAFSDSLQTKLAAAVKKKRSQPTSRRSTNKPSCTWPNCWPRSAVTTFSLCST